jgi:hypothetical protein
MAPVLKRPAPGRMASAADMNPAETARYTCELLDSLRKIATRQGQAMLAHLLELARYEAHSLTLTPSKTTTPDSPDAGHSAPPVPVPTER